MNMNMACVCGVVSLQQSLYVVVFLLVVFLSSVVVSSRRLDDGFVGSSHSHVLLSSDTLHSSISIKPSSPNSFSVIHLRRRGVVDLSCKTRRSLSSLARDDDAFNE